MPDDLTDVSAAGLATVVPFPAPERYEGRTCKGCGSAWFDAAVTIGPDGRTTSRAHVTCRSCGMEP